MLMNPRILDTLHLSNKKFAYFDRACQIDAKGRKDCV